MRQSLFGIPILVGLAASSAPAALALSQTEDIAPRLYANGGGTGFGGTLGNGNITMDVVGTDLQIGFTPGNALNDIVALYLDTRTGGFVDADMSDTADGGRTMLSEMTLTKNDVMPTGFLPDFGLAIGNFGSVLFELNAGNTPGHLNFQTFTPSTIVNIPLALLGNPSQVDFFAAYGSGGGYNSNESLPASAPLQGAGNPGFGDGQFGGLNTGGTYENFNRFVIEVPEPSSLCFIALAGFLTRHRR